MTVHELYDKSKDGMIEGTVDIEKKAKKKLQSSIEASLHEPFSSITGYLKKRVGRYANTEEES